MSIMFYLIFFFLSFYFTYLMRSYALKKNIIDNPNERSSHNTPTPRGGGVAVVCSFFIGLFVLCFQQQLSISLGVTLIGAGFVIALLGFLDDHGHINSMVRLAIHFIAAIGVVSALGGFSEITVFNNIELGFLGNVIAVLFLVWLLNLYNFMDGINGIASIEAITTVVSIAILYIIKESTLDTGILYLLASCVLGFLLWNFPKAKIFMGDACSGFLGFMIGIFALIALKQDITLFCAWLICLGVFIVDATYTLLKRVSSGFKMYDAHRSHSYQILSRKVNSHTPVSIGVLLINVFWLFPIAYLVINDNFIMPELGVLIAYIPLLLVATITRAGNPNA